MRLLKIAWLFTAILIVFVLAGTAVTYGSLAGTSWQLDHLVLHHERQTNYFFQRPSLQFEKLTIRGHDGCNDFTAGYLPLLFGRIVLLSTQSTLLGCAIVDTETGETINVNSHAAQFMEALRQAHRIEIDGQTMRVYFGAGEADMLVLRRLP